MRYEEYIRNLMEEFAEESLIPAEDFPDMNLYIDQVTEFLNAELKVYAPEEQEPVITKTMISNYVKHDMLPRPVRKKYTKDHLILITMIYYLKSTFQMTEIENLMRPFVENYDSAFDVKFDFQALYDSMLPVMRQERKNSVEEIQQDIEMIKEAIREDGLEDDDPTELFLLMLCIAMRVDAAKFAAQRLLREYFSDPKKK